jgi:glutathione S-transferase
MKLYYSPGLCSQSPHIVARELGIELELVKVDTHAHQLADGTDFYTINPKGYVPVLELDDGARLTEGPAIVQYLADLKPEAGLAPRNGTFERYRLQETLGFINSEVHKGFSPLFDKSLPADAIAAFRNKLGQRLDIVAKQLEGRDWLVGERFTVADAYLFVVLGWAGYVDLDLDAWPALKAFRQRVAQRPAVRDALKAETGRH